MPEVWKSYIYSSQMRLLGETSYIVVSYNGVSISAFFEYCEILLNFDDTSNALATLYALSPLVTSQNSIWLKLANKFANKFAPQVYAF